ncbi:MAG: hypothetical protein L6R39_007591 [Caloplaca ligustica]|nr:MAG: hypothetical protein L6R39_007591 [Caloplaca ligustica]
MNDPGISWPRHQRENSKIKKEQCAGGQVMYHLEDCPKFQTMTRLRASKTESHDTNAECICGLPSSEDHQLMVYGKYPTVLFRHPGLHNSKHIRNCDRVVSGIRTRRLDHNGSAELVNAPRTYDSRTIAFDVLRAARGDPTLPPLDLQLEYYVDEVIAAREKKRRRTKDPKRSSSKRPKANC